MAEAAFLHTGLRSAARLPKPTRALDGLHPTGYLIFYRLLPDVRAGRFSEEPDAWFAAVPRCLGNLTRHRS